jgi:hypothetical protein
MAKRISKKRMEEIRDGVADYVAKLDRGEIPATPAKTSIGLSEVQPSGQPSAEIDDREPGDKV